MMTGISTLLYIECFTFELFIVYHLKVKFVDLQVKSDSNLPDKEDTCQDGYVLKVLNSLDSKSNNLIDAQNEMMLYLGNYAFPPK